MKRIFVPLLILFIVMKINGQEKTDYKGSTIQYISGKDSVPAYLAIPEGEGPFPALIVIHEWWGLDDWIKQNADKFSEQGYAALAVDLYRGRKAGSSEEAHELMRGLPEDRAARDLKAAFSYLSSLQNIDKENIGSIGWCMGGSYSLQAAISIPDLDACVIAYGRLATEDETLDKINAPVLGIFGATDRGIPVADIREFESALKLKGKNVKIVIYPEVGHAFKNPNNKEGYNKEAAENAWKEIHAFLKKHLKDS